MADQNLDEVLAKLRIAAERKRFEAWRFYRPVEKHKAFFRMGTEKFERCFMAGNGNGKTEAGAFEITMHMTGLYPDWWPGYRFEKPVRVWAAGTSGEEVRDSVQTKLCGPAGADENLGTGMIPKSLFVEKPKSGRSAADSFDSIQVRHKSGGVSRLVFKTYVQERQHWQGSDLDLVWFDEEPPADRYAEGLARLRGRGKSILTFTPLSGMSDVVQQFHPFPTVGSRGIVYMGLDDATWYSPEQKSNMLAGYPAHEREARAKGVPLLGSGRVFSTPASDLEEDNFPDVPLEWAKLWGIDFGIDHPFAAVLLAWDKDALPAPGVIHVLHTIRMTGATPTVHAAAMKRVAANVPVAWPHDGNARDKGSGTQLAQLYRAEQLNMLGTHATHSTGGYATEAGIMELDQAMRDHRFRANRYLTDWFREFGMYHRKDGVIVKKDDDLMSATRIAWMMRRFAKPVPLGGQKIKRRRHELADGVSGGWGAY